MNQNNIPQSFVIEPYQIQLITKIVMQKPSGSVVKYRVSLQVLPDFTIQTVFEKRCFYILKKNVYLTLKLHISQPSANNGAESDRTHKEKRSSDGEDMETDEEEEGEEPVMQYGVAPFLCGVVPAGKLRATTKRAGCQASGLVQVPSISLLDMSFRLMGNHNVNVSLEQ